MTLKLIDDNRFGGYLIVWGDPATKDTSGEYFTKDTELCLDWYKERPALYHHGLDGETKTMVIGMIDTLKKDDVGLYAEGRFDIDDRLDAWEDGQKKQRQAYIRRIRDMVKRNMLNWSSGSLGHLVEVAHDGFIKLWPVIEGSMTPTPAEPRRTNITMLKTALSGVKSDIDIESLAARGINITPDPDGVSNQAGDGNQPEPANNPINLSFGGLKMDEMYAQLVQAVASALEVDVTPEQVNAIASQISADMATRTGKAQEEIDPDMVKAAMADKSFAKKISDAVKSLAPQPEPEPEPETPPALDVDLDVNALAQEAIKAGLPGGGSGGGSQLPAHSQSSGITGMMNKYDQAGLSAGDMHFLIMMREQTVKGYQAPRPMLKQMAAKAERELLQGKIRLIPEAIKSVRAIKDDEIINTGQTGYGDEWIPNLWLAELWMRDRQPNVVLPQFNPIDMPSNPYTMPLEGVDPEVYAVPETSNEAQMTNTSGNPTPISKAGTDNRTITAKKLALRMGLSEEENEDAIIPVLQQLRQQAIRTIANAQDNVLINADSSTVGNVNLSDGTPGATAKYMYGGGNGFIKHAFDASATVDFGGAPTLALMRAVRFKLDISIAYQPSGLVYFVDGSSYAALLSIPEFLTKEKAGDLATNITGLLGFVDAIPVLVTAELGLASIDGTITNAGPNDKGRVLCVYTQGWRPGYRRRVRVNTKYYDEYDAHQLTATTRMGLVTKGSASKPYAALGYNLTV